MATSQQAMAAAAAHRPAVVGLIPTVPVDVPICAVFIFLFATLAASHMTLFQLNRRAGRFFIFNVLLFGFSMSRIVACIMRLVWATRPADEDVQLVATIFVNAGILIVYVVNNLLTWRVIRTRHPRFGWHRVPRILYKVQLYLVIPIIIMVIVVIITNIKAPTPYRSEVARKILRFGQTYFLVLACQPLFLLTAAMLWPAPPIEQQDHFGHGRFAHKVALLYVTTALATLEAGFRAGTTWENTPLAIHPAWWDSRASFYCFGFMIDVILLITFLAVRIDKRFFVPKGSSGPFAYSSGEDRIEKSEDM